ncbi:MULTISPECIES: hypothetical protein [unclassified Actinopolyspora]|uniref:hypothetical protein n=1 Tax=Actinopolyspora TaxID=1849 RepID=UPI0013F59B41|nr:MULTISPECIES: hypothetical protein [unclassified Actinopolyspora]NHD16996.1 hypothetical protein [Actinopolyspora sp. BKK2]NHE76148.1 hypothetical protein [Actinopolyspora sp. BKK1]
MTYEEKTLLGTLAGVLLLAPVLLGLALGWPVWAWLPLALVLLTIPALLGRGILQRRAQQQIRQEMREKQQRTEDPPTPHPSCEVSGLRVPTVHPEYPLLLSANVHWIPGPGAAGPGPERQRAIAVESVHDRASAVTAETGALDHEITAHRLQAALGTLRQDGEGYLQAWATDVSLSLGEQDAERLRALSEAAKDEELRQRRRDQERGLREYLAEDALKDAGSAVVWWLAQGEMTKQHLEETLELVDSLDRLSQLAHSSGPARSTPSSSSRWWTTSERTSAETELGGAGQHGFEFDGQNPDPGILPINDQADRSALRIYFAKHMIETVHPEDEHQRALFADRVADMFTTHRMLREAAGIRAHYSLSEPAENSRSSDTMVNDAAGPQHTRESPAEGDESR